MAPRGRGGPFQARGGRGGRGGGRGARGGMRGKKSSQYVPQRRFNGSRLEDKDDDSDSAEDDSPAEPEEEESSDGEDSDTPETATSRPYAALLQSFNDVEEEEPRQKKRKLEHRPSPRPDQEDEVSPQESGDEEPGDGDGDAEQIDEPEDKVDGREEQEEEEEEEPDEDEDSHLGSLKLDPYEQHFAQPDQILSSTRVVACIRNDWNIQRSLMHPWRAVTALPATELATPATHRIKDTESMSLKRTLGDKAGELIGSLSPAEIVTSTILFNYEDLMLCDRTLQNAERLRKAVCLHALNHVFKTRDRVIKNNHKIAKLGQEGIPEIQDQGYTRPKILFLLPTRNACARVVNTIVDFCAPDQQENKKRFDESYIDKEAKFGENVPADHRDLFEGNDDDMFRLGMKFTRKTVKYFSQFYNSDILLASPLGLRMAIGSEGDRKVDYDFLSSIEIVVVDQADALLMQNWEHVEFIFEHLNLQPKEMRGCDIGRVRSWYFENWAKYFRQTIVLSAFNTPELVELQRTHCHNWAGKTRLQSEYTGTLQELGVKVKQTFSRFQARSVATEPDARFEYFTSAIIPSLVKRGKDVGGTLIFIPSYLDFVRVRNYFATSAAVGNIFFGVVSEYSDVREASRAQSHFMTGRHRVLLYTERAHHFKRHQLRGVERVIFYGLPDNALFYKEIAGTFFDKSQQNGTIEPGQGTVRVMFCKYDVMKLERVAGSKRVGKMIQDRGDTFDFV